MGNLCSNCIHVDVCEWAVAGETGCDKCSDYMEKRPHGKWVPSPITCEDFVCSECGAGCWYYDVSKYVKTSNFCPNCGADMRDDNNG